MKCSEKTTGALRQDNLFDTWIQRVDRIGHRAPFCHVFQGMRVAMRVGLNPHGTLMAREIDPQSLLRKFELQFVELWKGAEGPA